MKSHRLALIFLITALSLACSVQFADTPAAPVAPPAAPATLPPAVAPTDTVAPAPTNTAAPVPTATLGVPMVTPSNVAVNCRFGPGVEYESQGTGLAVGASAPIVGKTADGAWWQIQDPSAPAQKCFVSTGVTIASGDLTGVLVVAAPFAFVTDAVINAKPPSISAPGCMGPLMASTLKGSISVNGPVVVKWHFETQQGGVQPNHSINFAKFGSQDVSGSFNPSPAAGTYWVRLIITSPNNMVAEDTYEVTC